MAKRTMAYYKSQMKKVEEKIAMQRMKKDLQKKKDQLSKMR
mgnify:FL=1|tara:strand:+ start:185 stop:307 length:123 start_codon:yes stop_codon:yes gene_type:complete